MMVYFKFMIMTAYFNYINESPFNYINCIIDSPSKFLIILMIVYFKFMIY